MALKRAKRQMLIGAIAFVGASGAGKTLGALLVAYGHMKEKYPELSDEDIWSKIGLVDTEHERALVYEGMEYQGVQVGQFWHYDLKAPYSLDRFEKAFDELKAEGVEIIIVDSTSHAWEGTGGVLDLQQSLGGRFQDWNTANKDAYYPLVSLFTGEKHGVHVYNTMRAKQEYAMQPDDNGKNQVVKLGVKPIQRDSFEYEFQVVFSIGMDHIATTSKDNSGLFEGQAARLGVEHGRKLAQWLDTGVDIFAERKSQAAEQEANRLATVNDMYELQAEYNLDEWVAAKKTHPALNKPYEELPQSVLEKFHLAMLSEIDKIQNQTQKEGN